MNGFEIVNQHLQKINRIVFLVIVKDKIPCKVLVSVKLRIQSIVDTKKTNLFGLLNFHQ